MLGLAAASLVAYTMLLTFSSQYLQRNESKQAYIPNILSTFWRVKSVF